ncbi:BQ2448_288 [Microbotryum intermedium]|uniref:BQ2448_288 protein n=1 Tax=Microbotryum intermedium TaxID=269621 RepID=A0A238F557_9BASI|nr:BQ2448_288 [Microbotryum intermedium]
MAVAVHAPTRLIHSLARATLESDMQAGLATSALASSTSSALSSSSSSSEQGRPYAHARQPSTKRQRYTHQDDSIWAETLPDHAHTPQPLAEDDLEDILAMPVAMELKSRRSHASLLRSSSIQNLRSPASSAPPLSPSFHNGASAWTAHSNLPAILPGSTFKTSAATSQTASNRSIQSHTSRARSRSQSRLARPIDLVAPPMPSRSAQPPENENQRTEDPEAQIEWEILQVAEPTARIPCATKPSSGPAGECVSDAPAVTFPSVKKSTARKSPPSSSDTISGTSRFIPPRTRANTNAHLRSDPSPSANTFSPPVSSAPRKSKVSPSSSLNSRSRTRSNTSRPQRISPYLDGNDISPDATPPWMAAPAPVVFRSGEDGSLRGQGRVDEMVLPAVARRLEAERLTAASSTATSLLITEWDASGRPVRAGDVQAPLPVPSSNGSSLRSSKDRPEPEPGESGNAFEAGNTGPNVALKPLSRTSSLPPPSPAQIPLAPVPPSPVRVSETPPTPQHDMTTNDEEIRSKKALCGCTIS